MNKLPNLGDKVFVKHSKKVGKEIGKIYRNKEIKIQKI